MNPETVELAPSAEEVWVGTAPARILGMPLTTTVTVQKLDDGRLLLHSPTGEARALG